MQMLGGALQDQSVNLRKVMVRNNCKAFLNGKKRKELTNDIFACWKVGMAKLEAINASLTSLDEMRKQYLHAGFFGLCTHENDVEVCGTLSGFRNESSNNDDEA